MIELYQEPSPKTINMIFTSSVKQFTTNKDFFKETCEENYLRVKHEKWRHIKVWILVYNFLYGGHGKSRKLYT